MSKKITISDRVINEVEKEIYYIIEVDKLKEVLELHFHGPRQSDLDEKLKTIELAKDSKGFIKLKPLGSTDYEISHYNGYDSNS